MCHQQMDEKHLSLDEMRIELEMEPKGIYREVKRSSMKERNGMLTMSRALLKNID